MAQRTRTTMRIAVLLLISLVYCRGLAAQEEPPPQTVDELRGRIESILQKTHTPAIGIALVDKEGPYWVTGLGKADVEANKAADEHTLFRIGSISKMFVALAVLKLEEEGRLSLHDTVRERAPDVAFENPWEDTHPVRIAHLLEHTTGWDDIHMAEYAYRAPDSMTLEEALAYHPHSRVSRWIPGTRHAYCNAGPAVAAHIVERVTGQRFEDYIASAFFAPLGMDSTSYFKTALYEQRGARLYLGPQPQDYWQIIHRPSGSINSSAKDMAKFLHFLLLRGAAPTGEILSQRAFDRMEISATTLGFALGVEGGYGLANYTSGYKNRNVAFRGHNGGVIGGMSELAYVRELGSGYVVMINSGNGAALAQISDLMRGYILKDVPLTEPQRLPLPEQFKSMDGYYKPLNHRVEMMAFLFDVFTVTKIWSDGEVLHRKPLFASWISNDYAVNERTLVDAWHGLPAIAVVEDPLAGPALQVNSALYKRVPTWTIFAQLALLLSMLAMTLIGFVALLVWCYRRFAVKTSTDGRLWMRLWPLISTVLLVAFLLMLASAGALLKYVGTVSPVSIAILLLSLSYPIAVLLGTFELVRKKNRSPKNLPYWYASAFALVHLLIVGYLVSYGVVGIRTWA